MNALTTDELRTLFLFEKLTEEQLAWIAARAEVRLYDEGAVVYSEGAAGEALYLLLEGELRMLRNVNGEETTMLTSSHRGAYSGAMRAYVAGDAEPYQNTLVATRPSRFLRLPSEDFAQLMREWFPMATHLLDGLYVGVRRSEGTLRQREHLAQLGVLSANLAHELNNPAAATVRATAQLRERVAGMRHKLGMIAQGPIDRRTIAALVALQEHAVELAVKTRRRLTPVEEADVEDALIDRLEELGVAGAMDLAPVYVASGLGVEWLDQVVEQVCGDEHEGPLDGALRWLAYTLETENLMDEIEDASGRISELVAAVKQYSSMDSTSYQEVDLHVGLDSTVVMLGHKLTGVQVRREYDLELPKVPAYSAELNQVWTNLIDNASDAMGGTGLLVLRTSRDGDDALVDVQDGGHGIPADVQPRVFEAFYSTKGPGGGSGLGLDNARRIVVDRHKGQIDFTTGPDGTTFRVRLPLVRR